MESGQTGVLEETGGSGGSGKTGGQGRQGGQARQGRWGRQENTKVCKQIEMTTHGNDNISRLNFVCQFVSHIHIIFILTLFDMGGGSRSPLLKSLQNAF